MKVIKLIAENIKKLHAVEIVPADNIVVVGGKNGAGKSSVLDSIAYALGGKTLLPDEPIRAGESEARVLADLGDYLVTRTFKRERAACNCSNLDGPHEESCASRHAWGDTKTTLTVTSPDKAKYPSPQALLDNLIGKLTFDPAAFARADTEQQDKILRKLVGVDVALIDARRNLAFTQRTLANRNYEIKAAQLLTLTRHANLPAEEIPLAEINKAMAAAEAARQDAAHKQEDYRTLQQAIRLGEESAHQLALKVEGLEVQLAQAKESLADVREVIKDNKAVAEKKHEALESVLASVPDVVTLQDQLTQIEQTNKKIRENARHKEESEVLESFAQESAVLSKLIADADTEKKTLLSTAKFPIDGLGLSDHGVTFNGIPFAQASSAEQLRVSVAIGIALNPTLKVLFIRNGNLLDRASFDAVCAQAQQHDVQVWMEMVSEDGAGCMIMLEDGEVVEKGEAAHG